MWKIQNQKLIVIGMDFVEIDFNWHETKCDMILSFVVGCNRVQLILFYENFALEKYHFHWFRSIEKPFCIHVGKLFVSIFWKTKNKQKPQTFRLGKIQPKIKIIQMSRRHSSTRGGKKTISLCFERKRNASLNFVVCRTNF